MIDLDSSKNNLTKEKYSLSVFFPFYNEEKNINIVIDRAAMALEELKEISNYEIIIVDDGSSDSTKKLADEIVSKNNKIRLISHHKNLGYGKALLSGINNAQYDYVFFSDGDLQFDINEISKLLKHIPEYKAVIGYRYPRKDPLIRVVNAKIWKAVNRYAFGLRVRDANCAFKLFKRETVTGLNFVSEGAMLSAEILIRLQNSGVEIKEVHVTHFSRRNGSPTGARFVVIIRAIKEFVWLYLNTGLGNKIYLQAIKFIFVGLANTIVDVFFYFVLTRGISFFSIHVSVARVVSFLAGSICSLIINRLWTFERKAKLGKTEIFRFYTTMLAGLIIAVLSMKFFMHVFHLYDLIAILLSTVLTFLWNFLMSKFWVFK